MLVLTILLFEQAFPWVFGWFSEERFGSPERSRRLVAFVSVYPTGFAFLPSPEALQRSNSVLYLSLGLVLKSDHPCFGGLLINLQGL